MPDFFTESGAYQGTYQIGTVETEPHFQICATANINAANQFECTFWANRNGQRIDSGLGLGAYVVRDKSGALVSGLSGTSISPDVNGYFHITPVSAALIYDLNHYILELSVPVDGTEISSSIGLVSGE